MSRSGADGDDREELTDDQVSRLGLALNELRDELRRMLSISREAARPVDLDEPIGRLTRIDAIQQQHMTAASRREFDLRLRQVQQALGAIARGEYGQCRRCDEPIGFRRLEARPESPYCVECQDEVDRKHGA